MSSALPEVRDFRLRAVDGRLDGGAPLNTVHLQWQTAAVGTVSKQQQQHQESICWTVPKAAAARKQQSLGNAIETVSKYQQQHQESIC